ncbi:MAG TPA: hypothetical protein VKR58_05925 [Aquella sp.]|nr:hypothetical protein [Aquella sp.]
MDNKEPTIVVEEMLAAIAKDKSLSVEDVKARLSDAVNKGQSHETQVKLYNELNEAVQRLTEVSVSLAEDKVKKLDAEAFEEAAKDRLFEVYKNLPDTDPQKMLIKSTFQVNNNLSNSDTDLILDGTAYEKAMKAPIYKTNDRYDELTDARKANDLLALYVAGKGGVEEALEDDSPYARLKPATLKYCYDRLVKEQIPGIEFLEKGVNGAMDTLVSGQGLEWVPAQILSRNLYEDIWLQLLVAGNFQRFIATGPTFSYPIRTARTRGYCMNQATAVTDFFNQSVGSKVIPSYMGTNLIKFVAQKYGVVTYLSDELEQDAVFPILQAIYGDLAYGAADGIEDAVLNGSSTAALNDLDNQDTDTNRLWANTLDQGDGIRLNTKTSDARFLWNGIRQAILTLGTEATIPKFNASGTLSRANFLSTRALMLKYGVDPTQLFTITGPQSYATMLGFTEVATMEKYAANATVLRGELARMDNIPIIVSPRMYENLNASGVFDNVTTTKKCSLYVHKDAYAFADRMTLKVESERQILSQQRAVVASMRFSFNKMFLTTEPTEALIYNY